MVSTMLLCENINTAIGSIIINTTEAAPAGSGNTCRNYLRYCIVEGF